MKKAKVQNKQNADLLRKFEQMKSWAIQRGNTPQERYRLGPTDTVHTANDYYNDVLPIWCPVTSIWVTSGRLMLPPMSIFSTMVRGGLLDSMFMPVADRSSGRSQRIYVRDSAKTRDLIMLIQQQERSGWAWRIVKSRLVQFTFAAGWDKLFNQALALTRKLRKENWREVLANHILSLSDHIKVGDVLDQGLLPPDMLITSLRLLTVYVMDFLTAQHESSGFLPTKSGGKRRIIVVWGYKQLIVHQHEHTLAAYRASLHARRSGKIQSKKSYVP